MTYVDLIVERFGGLRAMAKALGHKNHATVQGWVVRGSIPDKRKLEVQRAARAAGVRLTAKDFFPREEPA